MALTVQQIVNLSLRDIQVILSGQLPSTDQSNDCFNTIQELIASWGQEGLMVPTHALSSFALTAATSGYTFGVSATWATAGLPIKLKGAISSLTGFQQGMDVMAMEDFEKSIANALGKTAALPLRLGIDNSAPMRNVRVWPTPNSSSAVVEASYWMPLAPFVALTDVVAFALPAFEMAVRTELTLRLAAMYGSPVTQTMLANAQASKLALTRLDPSEITDRVPAQPPAPSGQTGPPIPRPT